MKTSVEIMVEIQNVSVLQNFNLEKVYFTKFLKGKKKAKPTLINKTFRAGGQMILFIAGK